MNRKGEKVKPYKCTHTISCTRSLTLVSKVGLLSVRLFRPWSAEHFLSSLPKSVKRITILDRVKVSLSPSLSPFPVLKIYFHFYTHTHTHTHTHRKAPANMSLSPWTWPLPCKSTSTATSASSVAGSDWAQRNSPPRWSTPFLEICVRRNRR